MNTARRAMAVLVAVVALVVAPAAYATLDYSKNSVSGEYAPAVTAPAEADAASTDSGFAWGAAAIGAGGALVLVLLVTRIRGGFGPTRTRREAV